MPDIQIIVDCPFLNNLTYFHSNFSNKIQFLVFNRFKNIFDFDILYNPVYIITKQVHFSLLIFLVMHSECSSFVRLWYFITRQESLCKVLQRVVNGNQFAPAIFNCRVVLKPQHFSMYSIHIAINGMQSPLYPKWILSCQDQVEQRINFHKYIFGKPL